MKTVVYADVLFIVNMFVNYFILLAAGRLTGITLSRLRILFGALLGGLYSFYIFLPDMNFFISLLVKLIFSFSIVFVSFKRSGYKVFFKLLSGFYIISFLFAGIMLLIWYAFKPPAVLIHNGVVYFDISLLTLTLSTIICYLIISVCGHILKRRAPDNKYYDLTVFISDLEIRLKAIVDTGNALSDSFTNSPVIVADIIPFDNVLPRCTRDFFKNVSSPSDISDEYWRQRLRIIPYSGVGANGVLPAVRSDSVLISGGGKQFKKNNVIIAICAGVLPHGDFSALLNPRLVE